MGMKSCHRKVGHAPEHGKQAVGEERRVAALGELFFGGVSSYV